MAIFNAPAPFNPEKPNELHDQSRKPPAPESTLLQAALGLIPTIVLGVAFLAMSFTARAAWDNHREWFALFIPIHVPGALFSVGDGHAAQGDGEVDLTALETSLTGTLRFVVRKDLHLQWPRAETPTHYIAMGLDKDLTQATRIAVREAIDFLVTEKRLSRDDAYMLTSVAVDFRITQLVDGVKGVHAMIPKGIFTKR